MLRGGVTGVSCSWGSFHHQSTPEARIKSVLFLNRIQVQRTPHNPRASALIIAPPRPSPLIAPDDFRGECNSGVGNTAHLSHLFSMSMINRSLAIYLWE